MLRLLFILFTFTSIIFSQHINESKLFAPYATEARRIEFDKQINKQISNLLKSNSPSGNEYTWISGLEAVLSTYNRTDTVFKKISEGFESISNNSFKVNYRLIEAANALFPHKFKNEMIKVVETSHNIKLSSAAISYLLNIGISDSVKIKIKNQFLEKFNKKTDPVYQSVLYMLNDADTISAPPLEDMLRHNFQKGKTIIYSLQRKDRTYPGITIIKDKDGNFLLNEDSTIFQIPHLCRSLSNLPSFLRNGNTPQGIYSLIGTYVSPTETIGPTPNLLLRSPFEVSTTIFYHKKASSTKWLEEDYKKLLPESWQNYFPIWEAWNAGKLGRRLIVSHGSTDDIKYYKNEPFYPLTPTKGCMSAKEIWDTNGRLLESDQVKLMERFMGMGQLYGFFIVVEIDDKKEAVTVDEVEELMGRSSRQ